MNFKRIDTNGIECIEEMEGTDQWYWGSDYCSGDLYEAEEMFQSGHTVKGNRLVLVKYPEGIVEEPILRKDGQYFGRPVFDHGAIMILLADFTSGEIKVIRYDTTSREMEIVTTIEIEAPLDCYNLMLRVSPVYLSRDRNEGVYEILWPEKAIIMTEENESIYQREDDILISSRWYENPEYHEETILRRYPTGEILESFCGAIIELPDKQRWIVG